MGERKSADISADFFYMEPSMLTAKSLNSSYLYYMGLSKKSNSVAGRDSDEPRMTTEKMCGLLLIFIFYGAT